MSRRTPPAYRVPLRTRWTRWLGLDKNPMRRMTDRIETGVKLMLLLMLVTAVPATAVVVGLAVDHSELGVARAQTARSHLVSAVLLQTAPANTTFDPYGGLSWARARWTAPDGTSRTGEILATPGAPKGSTVQTWVKASGALASAPEAHAQIVGDVFVAGALTSSGLVLVLALAWTLAKTVLVRRRLASWAGEWESLGPRWSGHRRA